MQVVVLNGVNLDVLARRDPALYGGMSLSELETRIYEWAAALGCHVRCRQTNHEGEYVDWCHDAYDWADGVIVNPGAWSHYSYAIRDALELLRAPSERAHRPAACVTRRAAARHEPDQHLLPLRVQELECCAPRRRGRRPSLH